MYGDAPLPPSPPYSGERAGERGGNARDKGQGARERSGRAVPAHPPAPPAPIPAPKAPQDHDPYAVLRNRPVRRYLLAGMAATVGGQMQGVAVGWEVYERTGSPTALGLVGLAQVLPVILLALPAGHLADRYDRA